MKGNRAFWLASILAVAGCGGDGGEGIADFTPMVAVDANGDLISFRADRPEFVDDRVELTGMPGQASIESIDFDADGTLYAMTDTNGFGTIDATGTYTETLANVVTPTENVLPSIEVDAERAALRFIDTEGKNFRIALPGGGLKFRDHDLYLTDDPDAVPPVVADIGLRRLEQNGLVDTFIYGIDRNGRRLVEIDDRADDLGGGITFRTNANTLPSAPAGGRQSFDVLGRYGYVVGGATGRELVRIDLDTGAIRSLGTIAGNARIVALAARP